MRYSLTCGVFDCLHQGHVNLFKKMKEKSEHIVVVLHDDLSTFKNKGRFPVQGFDHRWHNLKMSGYVDELFPTNSQDPSAAISNAITLFNPVVYMRGDDWPDFPGRRTIEAALIPIVMVPYTEGVSTTKIRGELKRRTPKWKEKYLL
jgi:glycerol-3-phosphate cytidylyltransferase